MKVSLPGWICSLRPASDMELDHAVPSSDYVMHSVPPHAATRTLIMLDVLCILVLSTRTERRDNQHRPLASHQHSIMCYET